LAAAACVGVRHLLPWRAVGGLCRNVYGGGILCGILGGLGGGVRPVPVPLPWRALAACACKQAAASLAALAAALYQKGGVTHNVT